MATRPRRVAIVVNPVAGGDPDGVADAAARRAEAADADVEILATRYPGHAEALAAGLDLGSDGMVVAVGGDGTVRDVASGLYRAYRDRRPAARRRGRPVLLAAPAGTGNSTYLGVWGDRPWSRVLDQVWDPAASRVCRLDLAEVVESGQIALLGAGSGVIAEALTVARRHAAVPGRQRYRLALAETLAAFRPYPGRVLVDGEVLAEGPTALVAVGGGRYRGGGFRLLPESVLDDGLLDVCAFTGQAPLGELAGLAAEGRHLGHPGVRYGRGREVTIARTDGADLVFECDGDLEDPGGPVRTLRVLEKSLPVAVPAID